MLLITTAIVFDRAAVIEHNRTVLKWASSSPIFPQPVEPPTFLVPSPVRMDNGPRTDHWDVVGSAMAFDAQHEALMTSHPLTSHSRNKHWLCAAVMGTSLALSGIAPTAGAASARGIYDGAWSVLIVTRSGSCDPSYRYGVQITDGMVTYDGGGPISMQGRVTPKGAVRVIVTAGSQWADGSGKLTRNQGGGVWKGQGMSSACAGTWQAERRVD
jgi:hypothetical protein